jgi:predicted nucleic acid-binding protein
MSSFIDTNVLLYAISGAPAEKSKRAVANDLVYRRDCVLSVQVLQEFYAQATRSTRPDALSHPQASAFLEALKRFRIIDNTVTIFDAAMELRTSTNYSFWDCSIIAAARAGGCETLYSEDLMHGHAVDGVTIVNPFR